MKRLHVHVAVADLDTAISFYSGLFAAAPTVREHDYAKWQLDDPRVNFAVSARGKAPGVEHLGIEAADGKELGDLQQRIEALDGRRHDERRTTCCYAVSDKSWKTDPAGVKWELFHTLMRVPSYGADPVVGDSAGADPTAGPAALPPETSGPGGRCCG